MRNRNSEDLIALDSSDMVSNILQQALTECDAFLNARPSSAQVTT